MEHTTIPVRFFPSTTIFVDDCSDFLLGLVLELDEDLAYKSYNDPAEALALINKHHASLPSDSLTMHHEVYNPQRFSEISVVVVDCSMPEMNGLDFCEQIKNPSIKKILLTGKSQEAEAIAAMKAGLIHRYVKKSDHAVVERISKAITELQKLYFIEQSAKMMTMISKDLSSCLQNKTFVEFFETLCQQKRVVEYYLMDPRGLFLMLDEDANPSILLLQTDDDLKQYALLAKRHGMSEEELQPVLRGEKMPCMWPLGAEDPEWNEWAEVLVPAAQIRADKTWSYAHVQEPALLLVEQEELRSFHHYLEGIDSEELFNLSSNLAFSPRF